MSHGDNSHGCCAASSSKIKARTPKRPLQHRGDQRATRKATAVKDGNTERPGFVYAVELRACSPSIHEALALTLSLNSISGEARLELVILFFQSAKKVGMHLTAGFTPGALSFLLFVSIHAGV